MHVGLRRAHTHAWLAVFRANLVKVAPWRSNLRLRSSSDIAALKEENTLPPPSRRRVRSLESLSLRAKEQASLNSQHSSEVDGSILAEFISKHANITYLYFYLL